MLLPINGKIPQASNGPDSEASMIVSSVAVYYLAQPSHPVGFRMNSY
jgi:hypothetical protein